MPNAARLALWKVPHLKRAEPKLLRVIRSRCGFDERKHRIRELFPDRDILRRYGKPTKAERVTTGLGQPPELSPGDFIDAQFLRPADYHRPARKNDR